MVVGRDIVGNWLNWATYCISLLEATAEGMNYHDNFWKQSGTLVYNSQTWYYSYEAAGALATTTERDNTQPPNRRFYIGDFDSSVNDFTQLALTMLLDYIYT